MPSKLNRLINNTTVPKSYGPHTFCPFVIILKLFLKFYNVPPLKLIEYTPNIIPFWTWQRADNCKEMFICSKKKIPPITLKLLFLEHQQKHADTISIYTDGSRRKMPLCSSALSVELGAISLIISRIPWQPHKQYTIYIDFQSALQAIDSFNSKHLGVRDVQVNINFLHERKIYFSLCWSPRHVETEENEAADEAVKASVLDTSIKIIRTS